ncbi:MAG: hypothetical protein FWD69_19070, partial [Polyangiaceae bacterium]|nr:hypothetical protein [Polyangiaceae bacterium]
MPLSARTSQSEVPNALSAALFRARETEARGGAPLLDLTVSNPTTAGIPYDERALLDALTDPRSLTYAPEPLGLLSARQAVAGDYAASGIAIDASRIALTASTSEAYGALSCGPIRAISLRSLALPCMNRLVEAKGIGGRSEEGARGKRRKSCKPCAEENS